MRKISLIECREMAKEIGFDSCHFDLVGPKGKIKAKWLDAYLGLLQIDKQKGFIMSNQLRFFNDLWCENIHVKQNKILTEGE
jgi:hypothetical protein